MLLIQAIEKRNRKLSQTELIHLVHTNYNENREKRQWHALGDETINSNLVQTKKLNKSCDRCKCWRSRCKRIHNLTLIQSTNRMWMNVVVNNTTNDAQTKGFLPLNMLCPCMRCDAMCIIFFISLFEIHCAYYSFYIQIACKNLHSKQSQPYICFSIKKRLSAVDRFCCYCWWWCIFFCRRFCFHRIGRKCEWRKCESQWTLTIDIYFWINRNKAKQQQ